MPLNAIATIKDIRYIMKKVNYFFSERLPPVFSNSVQARKQPSCLRPKNCYIGKFLWALPKPAIFEKIW
jgi:hypothetical protein